MESRGPPQKPTEKKRPGRPPKLHPEISKKICDAIRAGNFRETSALWAGVSAERLSKWMHHPGFPYVEFQRAVIEAEQAAHVRAVTIVMNKATEDPRHAQWWLERKFPDLWGRRDHHEITGPNGGPMQVQVYLPAERED